MLKYSVCEEMVICILIFYTFSGAMVTEEKICRVFDYFFEMEIIDDRDDHFMVASKYAENSQLSFYLESIVQYL